MVVYNQIQHDARVIRAAECISKTGENICVLSCNSDPNYSNPLFTSVSLSSSLKGPLLLIRFWLFVFCFCVKNKLNIKLLYMHDYFMPYIGKILSFFLHKKWIYDAHELLLQNKKNRMGLRALFFLYNERFSIRNASLVIAANDERARIIKYVYKLRNVISVCNIAPYNNDYTLDEETKREDYIVYQGVLSEERQISTYIKMLCHLPDYVKLKLIGGGPDSQYYNTLVNDLHLENRVKFTGRIPYARLIEESRGCKIGIVSYLMDDLNNYYCSPNKLFEYIQYGIPVIVSPQPFLKAVVSKFSIGEVWDIRKDSMASFVEKVMKILNNRSAYQSGMNSFNAIYTCENEMKKMEKAVCDVLCQLK